nr:GntR family transcriptional regulator [uncultured Cohaesibacter sp.]
MTAKLYRKGSAALEICAELRKRILTLELRPGASLDETQLSAEFEVSRSPIRDALNRLSAERLVVASPNKGAIVAPIDLMGFPHFMEAMDLQQRYASRLAARNRTSADLERLKRLADDYNQAVRTFDPLTVLQSNYDFHLAIAKAGRNPYVTRQYQELLSQARRYLHIHIEHLIAVEGKALLEDQHYDFVDAIRARDVEEADRVAHSHTKQFETRFLKALQHQSDVSFQIEVSSEGDDSDVDN